MFRYPEGIQCAVESLIAFHLTKKGKIKEHDMFRYPEGIQCVVEHLLALYEDTLHKCKNEQHIPEQTYRRISLWRNMLLVFLSTYQIRMQIDFIGTYNDD